MLAFILPNTSTPHSLFMELSLNLDHPPPPPLLPACLPPVPIKKTPAQKVDLLPESLLGNMLGYVDDALLGLVFIIHISIVYRAVLLSWERGRLAHAAPNGGNRDGGDGRGGIQGALSHSMQGAGVAAVGAVFGGMMASAVGACSWVAGATAVGVGFAAAVVVARPPPHGRAAAVRVVDGDNGTGGDDDGDGGGDGAAAVLAAMLNPVVLLE